MNLVPVDRNSNVIYKRKCSKLKKVIKKFVYENAALCDQVFQLQERIIGLREERNYLIKKINTHESAPKTVIMNEMDQQKPNNTAGHQNQKMLAIKKRAQELSWERVRPKKPSNTNIKRKVLIPVPVDNAGLPCFPINLGSLSVYSLGEVLADRPAFHDEDVVYPVGFCSTRVYGSVSCPTEPTIYTCMILDSGTGPVFEISCDAPEINATFTGDNINKVHSELLQRINQTLKAEVVNTKGRGADFFGISHPSILNLIQGSAATKKCINYIPTKFEINRTGEPYVEENDASLTFESLQRSVNFSKSHIESLNEIREKDAIGNSSKRLRGLLCSS